MTTDEIRAAAIRELRDFVDILPDLAPHEFTISDFCRQFGLRRNKAERELRRLQEDGRICGGDLDRDWRYDQRTRRRVLAFWMADDAG